MESRLSVPAMLLLVVASCRPAVQTPQCDVRMPTLKDDPALPVVAVYRRPSGRRIRMTAEDIGPQIIVIAWSDGRIIWSEDRLKGGRPYLTGRIAPKKLDAFFASLERQGVREDRLRRRQWLGLDSDYLVTTICRGAYCVHLESWHELAEARDTLVATAAGITALNGRPRQEVLAEQPDDYRLFREMWLLIRSETSLLIPDNGTPVDGLHFQMTEHRAR